MRLTASVIISNVSGVVRKDIVTQFSNCSGFPQTDEELDNILQQLDKLCPQNVKTKQYILFLCKQLWKLDPPGFILGEDEAAVRKTLHDFDKLVSTKALSGKDADIHSYATLGDLSSRIRSLKEDHAVKSVEYTEEQQKVLEKGATIVARDGDWVAYCCKGTAAGKAAAQLLCDNDLHGVSWCVGRGTTRYLDEGNFYVLEKNGVSRYAISTEQAGATIWNPSDVPVWNTMKHGGSASNLEAQAKSMGIQLDFSNMSTLPEDIIGILKAATAKDSYLAKKIPSSQLVSGDYKQLDQVILACSASGLIDDLNDLFESERSVGLGSLILGRAIAIHYPFDWARMATNSMVAFIELYAATGAKSLPEDLEAFFIADIESKS